MTAFYRGVEGDPALRYMYPKDLEEPRKHLELFLIQYFGGPQNMHGAAGPPAPPHAAHALRHRRRSVMRGCVT